MTTEEQLQHPAHEQDWLQLCNFICVWAGKWNIRPLNTTDPFILLGALRELRDLAEYYRGPQDAKEHHKNTTLFFCPQCNGTGRIDPRQKRILALEAEVAKLKARLALTNAWPLTGTGTYPDGDHPITLCGSATTDGAYPDNATSADVPVTHTAGPRTGQVNETPVAAQAKNEQPKDDNERLTRLAAHLRSS